MEMTAGQYTRRGPIGALAKICPIFKGIYHSEIGSTSSKTKDIVEMKWNEMMVYSDLKLQEVLLYWNESAWNKVFCQQ